MIVFRWEKYEEHSFIYLKEFLRDRKAKFWRWKSIILCKMVFDFKITNIVINEDTKRYVIYTNTGIFEADEIETCYINKNIEMYNSTCG